MKVNKSVLPYLQCGMVGVKQMSTLEASSSTLTFSGCHTQRAKHGSEEATQAYSGTLRYT